MILYDKLYNLYRRYQYTYLLIPITIHIHIVYFFQKFQKHRKILELPNKAADQLHYRGHNRMLEIAQL